MTLLQIQPQKCSNNKYELYYVFCFLKAFHNALIDNLEYLSQDHGIAARRFNDASKELSYRWQETGFPFAGQSQKQGTPSTRLVRQ